MRNGLRPQPARLVRGSSRRIMAMRFRPANIRVINRRASSFAVTDTAVQPETAQGSPAGTCSRLRRPSDTWVVPERCSTARVRYAAPNTGAPLPSPRRSGQLGFAMGGFHEMARPCQPLSHSSLRLPPRNLGHWIGGGQGRAEGALVLALTASGQCLTQDRGRRRELLSETSFSLVCIAQSAPDLLK